MKTKPLDDLEMFELLQAAYPENFSGDDDATWDAAMDFVENLNGFDEIADLLGRVAMLTMPMEAGITKRLSHCLGAISFDGSSAHMLAAVRRDCNHKGDKA